MKLHQRLFGHIATDSLHLLLVGNSISLIPGLVTLALGGLPTDWLSWVMKLFQIAALALLGTTVLLEYAQLRTRPDRRHLLNIPWPQLK